MSSKLIDLVPAAARYQRQTMPDQENALLPWVDAAGCFREWDGKDRIIGLLIYGTDDGRPAKVPEGAECDRVNELLEANRQTFDLIDNGIACQRLQLPPVTGKDTLRPEATQLLHQWIHIGQLRAIRMRFLLHENAADAAAAEAVNILRMGEMLCNGEGLVTDYLIGVWLRNAGVHAVQRLSKCVDSSATLEFLLSEIDISREKEDGLTKSMRVELCCYTIPQLTSIPEELDTELLVNRLLERYYSSCTADEICEAMEPRISAEVREERLRTRRDQLLFLLREHPCPFDRAETIRSVARSTADHICWLDSTRKRHLWNVHSKWRKFTKRRRHGTERRVVDAWPSPLWPEFPLDYFGDDMQATAARDELRAELGRREGAYFDPLSRRDLTAARDTLMRIQNPVGLMLQSHIQTTDAVNQFVFEYWNDLQLATRMLRKSIRHSAPGLC